MTVAAGLAGLFPEVPEPHSAGMSAGDINGDGWLDLLISEWAGPTRLMINNTNGTFTAAGAGSGIPQTANNHWQAMMHDFDGDGALDIYSAIDFNSNHLWINDGTGVFTDQAIAAGVDNVMNDMGLSLADWDNDGDFDIYVTNVYTVDKHNVFFRNDSTSGNLVFSEISQSLGVHDGDWGWGTTALDVDNDGWLDIAATNGFSLGEYWPIDPSKLFLNSATTPLAFTNISSTSGFDDTYWGSSLLAFDHDRDGDLDLIQTCNGSAVQPHALRLLDNQGVDASTNNYIVIKPRLAGPNHRAIGAVVRITIGALEMARLITAGTSFMGQEPAEAFFGIGSAVTVDQIMVDWPDGTTTQQSNVASNQVRTIITEPDADSDGTDNGDDCAPLNGQAWNPPGETLDVALSGSGTTTITWSAPAVPGGLSLTYDTIASSAADDFAAAATCLESAGSDTQTVDTEALSPGAVRHILVRATNPCGSGSGGTTSLGVTRALLECP
ncbi:MAG: CRTAC1 family protein [Acidobacteriota bacterium]|nr:CRTAC1 family protein [Acidobacteriota bacterium]